jgi:uncharacterized protein YcfL
MNIPKCFLSLGAAAVAALTLAGCTTVNTVENAQKEGQRNMVSDQRCITDSSLKKKVDIVGINTALTPGGMLKVQVELVNRTRSLRRFNYRFEWFDLNGMQVNGIVSAVIADQIEGGESKFVSSVAPTAACKDFRLKLLESH